MPLLLTESDVARCLDMPSLIPVMRDALARFSRGDVVQPVRQSLAIRPAGGFYGVMPAHVPGENGGAFGLKSVSFFPHNDRLGLPTHLAQILLLDGRTGALVAVMDGRLITEMRTAAVSAVSVDLLARRDARRLALIGAGVQARSHLEAIACVRPLESVRVWSRTAASAERFAGEHAALAPCPIEARRTVQEAVAGADIVVTAVPSHEPVLRSDWIGSGAHLCVVGSSHPRHREVDTETILRSRVFVDSRAAAAVEAGDLLIPEAEEVFDLDWIVGELGDVAGGAPGRTSVTEITLFKSLGIAVEDIASAQLVVARAKERGVGTDVAL